MHCVSVIKDQLLIEWIFSLYSVYFLKNSVLVKGLRAFPADRKKHHPDL